MQGKVWEFLGNINYAWSLKGFLAIFILLKILQYLEIISKLWILDIVRGFLRALFIWSFYLIMELIMFIELCKIAKGLFGFSVSITHNSVSITHNSKMVGFMAKFVWIFITLFPVFVSIT